MPFNVIGPLYPKRAVTSSGTSVTDQSITVGVAASAFATAFHASTNLVTFDVQTANIRVRWDGTAPTSTTGHLLASGTAYTWSVSMAANASFIRDTAATADAKIWLSELSA